MRREMNEWKPAAAAVTTRAPRTSSTAAAIATAASTAARVARDEGARITNAMDRIQRRVVGTGV